MMRRKHTRAMAMLLMAPTALVVLMLFAGMALGLIR